MKMIQSLEELNLDMNSEVDIIKKEILDKYHIKIHIKIDGKLYYMIYKIVSNEDLFNRMINSNDGDEINLEYCYIENFKMQNFFKKTEGCTMNNVFL